MRNPEHHLSLGPGTEELQVPQEVESSTFDFFIYRLSPEPHFSQFADTLSLPQITPSLQKVATFDNEVYVHDEETRAMMLDEFDENGEYEYPTLSKVLRSDLRSKREVKANKKAQGERFSLISLNLLDLTLESSDPVAGNYDNVYVSPEYTVSELHTYNLPIMEVHSHPDNTLFSPVDYTNLLSKLQHDKRMFRGTAVICPDIQLLALATKQTPLLSQEKAHDVTVTHMESIYTSLDTQLTEPRTHLSDVTEQTNMYMQEIAIGIMPQLKELEEMQKTYNLSSEACMDAVNSLIRQHTPTYDEDEKRFKAIRASAKKELDDLASNIINEALITFARDMRIRLYSSQNMQDFIAFSA